MILIDMEMPKGCSECWFSARQTQTGIDWYLCLIPQQGLPRLIGRGIPIKGRDYGCPLIEVTNGNRNPEDAYREDFGNG